jgi:hypothetical protein
MPGQWERAVYPMATRAPSVPRMAALETKRSRAGRLSKQSDSFPFDGEMVDGWADYRAGNLVQLEG